MRIVWSGGVRPGRRRIGCPRVVRRLGTCLALAALAAIVTGPSGDADHPLAGVIGSFAVPRVFVFAGLGVALWTLVLGSSRLTRAAADVTTRAPAALRRHRLVPRHPLLPRYAALLGYAALLAIAVSVPPALPTAAQQALVSEIGIYALLALGLNVVVGYAGLLDLGYIAFFAIGSYTAAYLTSATAMPWHAPLQINPFLALPVALGVAALAGVVLGGPTLRLRGDYLAIVTLGFGEIVQLLANNADGVTGGPRGVFGVPPLSIDVAGLRYSWGLDPLPYYYLLLVLIVGVMIVFGRWERSRTGRAWTALRQDEIAAQATGVPTMRMKLLAFAIGASVSGFAGVVLATKQFFNPQSFGLQASLLVLTIVIFGGMGSRLGVVLGALMLQGTAFLLRDRVPPADRFIYFGAMVVIMMIFRSQGLLPSRRRSAAAASAAPPEPPERQESPKPPIVETDTVPGVGRGRPDLPDAGETVR